MFPDELPRRLIKMFAFIGDTVLDPFLGSGTTVKVALEQKRNAVGCEINEEFLEIVIPKCKTKRSLEFGKESIAKERLSLLFLISFEV